MSQCFRNISNKFITVNTLLSTKKHVRQLDKELPHRIKPSTFLEEFLNTRSITSVAVNPTHKSQDQVTSPLVILNISDGWREASVREEEMERKNEFPQDNKAPMSLNPIMSSVKRYEISSDDIIVWSNYCDNSKSLITHEIESLEKTYMKLSNGHAMLKLNNVILSDYEKKMILLADNKLNIEKPQSKQSPPSNDGKPSQEQLQHIFNRLGEELPKIFAQPMDYTIYRHDIEFVNNIRGTVTKGILNYVKQIGVLRIIGHLKFAYVKLEVLKMTLHPEDGTIKVRWRIRGISGIKALVFFWKIKLWNLKEALDQQELWYDGFSTFYVASDGLIYKHVADKMMPDQDQTPVAKDENAVAAKLALFLGLLVPGGTLSNMYQLTSESRHHHLLVKQLNGEKMCLEIDLLPLEKLK